VLAHNVQFTMASAVAISSTNTVTSSALPHDGLSKAAIAITTTSTATGTAKLQATVDGSTWVDLPNSGETANKTISGAGSQMWSLSVAPWKQVRVSYTNATNSGTLSVVGFAKS
jgi:hypothetical protein